MLATVSLGLAMSPAAAAPDTTNIDSVQARVDKLAQKAETADAAPRQGGREAAKQARTAAARPRRATCGATSG